MAPTRQRVPTRRTRRRPARLEVLESRNMLAWTLHFEFPDSVPVFPNAEGQIAGVPLGSTDVRVFATTDQPADVLAWRINFAPADGGVDGDVAGVRVSNHRYEVGDFRWDPYSILDTDNEQNTIAFRSDEPSTFEAGEVLDMGVISVDWLHPLSTHDLEVAIGPASDSSGVFVPNLPDEENFEPFVSAPTRLTTGPTDFTANGNDYVTLAMSDRTHRLRVNSNDWRGCCYDVQEIAEIHGPTIGAVNLVESQEFYTTLMEPGRVDYLRTSNEIEYEIPPNLPFGSEIFTYTAEPTGKVHAVRVEWLSEGYPDGVNERYTVQEDTEILIDLLAGDQAESRWELVGVEADAARSRLLPQEQRMPVLDHQVIRADDGKVLFAPAEDFFGELKYRYFISDGVRQMERSLTLDVTPVPDLPRTRPDSLSLSEGGNLA